MAAGTAVATTLDNGAAELDRARPQRLPVRGRLLVRVPRARRPGAAARARLRRAPHGRALHLERARGCGARALGAAAALSGERARSARRRARDWSDSRRSRSVEAQPHARDRARRRHAAEGLSRAPRHGRPRSARSRAREGGRHRGARAPRRAAPTGPPAAGSTARGPRTRADLALLLRAIGAAHGRGFLHGDLHLGNLLVRDGAVVFLDLQRARFLPWVPPIAAAPRARLLRVLARRAAAARARLRCASGATGARRRHWRSRTRRCLQRERRIHRVRARGRARLPAARCRPRRRSRRGWQRSRE